MDTDAEKADVIKENAVYLRNQATGAARSGEMKLRYRTSKQADALKSYGANLAKTLANCITEDQKNPVPETDDLGIAWDHSGVMVWNATNGPGGKIFNLINEYQKQSAQQVGDKLKSLTDFLSRNKDKSAAASPIKHLPNSFDGSGLVSEHVPDFNAVLKLVSGLQYEDQDGAAPWLVSVRPERNTTMTASFPLPGLATVVQLVEASECPVSFLLTPVKALLEAGLTILSDLNRFANTDSGASVVAKHSIFVTLDKHTQMLWVPMGFLPTVVGRPKDSDNIKFTTSSFWCKTIFCKHLAVALPHPEWVSIQLLNQPYLQNLSGQKIFRNRLQTFEQLCSDRSALQVGFSVETLMDCDAEELAQQEALQQAMEPPACSKPPPPQVVSKAPRKLSIATPKATAKATATAAAKSGAAKVGARPKPKATRSRE